MPTAFQPLGPMPFSGLLSRVDALLDLAVGATVAYVDLWGWHAFSGTISAIDQAGKTITVTAANAPGSPITLSFAHRDSAAALPITILT